MEKVEALLAWAEERGIRYNGIIPKHLPGRGVGVVVTRDVEPGEIILEVPTSNLRSTETVPKHVRAKLPKDLSVQGLLAADLALDDTDKYTPWNAVCPSLADFSSMPLLWPSALQSLLPGPARKLLSRQQAKLAKDRATIAAAFPDIDNDRYTHGWLLANTRTFSYNSPRRQQRGRREEDRTVLQPVADLLNHADADVCDVSFGDASFTVRADRAYSPGDEVHICYGRHGGDFLMVEYGFAMAENRWDEAGLDDVVLPALDGVDADVKEMLEDRGFLGGYVLDSSQVCYRTQVALRTLCCGKREWSRFVDGMDDGERSQRKVDELLIELLGKYAATVKKRISDIEVLQDGEPCQRDLLAARWRHILRLVEGTVERLRAEIDS